MNVRANVKRWKGKRGRGAIITDVRTGQIGTTFLWSRASCHASRAKYPFESSVNTTREITVENVMGPPSAPISRTTNNRTATSAINSSLNTTDRSGGPRIRNPGGFLDLSQTKGLWTPKYKQLGSGQIGSTSRGISGSRSRTTPCSTATSSVAGYESCIVLALSEGRGLARGEVGLAAIDLRRPSLTLCQISDSHSYLHTLTALHFFNPVEIVVPNTFCDNVQTELYRVVKQSFPYTSLTTIQRRHFSDSQGLLNIKSLCAPEYASVQLQLIHKFYALTSAAAILKYVEYIQCVVFQPNTLKIDYHCSKNSIWIDVETAIRLELVESLSSSIERGSSLLSVLNHATTAGGLRSLRASILQPSCDVKIIKERADAVQELIENNEGLLPGLQNVMRQLYDVDKILWLCIDWPSQTGLRTGEAQLNHTLQLKNTMELVTPLVSALELGKSGLLTRFRKDLEDPKFLEISERIKRVIHEEFHGRTSQHQRCFAVKPEINGLLDVARRSYSELVSDIQERVNDLADLYNLPLRLSSNTTRGFHIVLPLGPRNKRTFSVVNLPPVLIEVHDHGSSLSMTTEEVVLLDQQAKEALNEIQTMSNIVIYGLLTELRPYMSVLYKLCEHVAELDVIISLAQVSSAGYYVRPSFSEYMNIKDSKHPMLDYVLPGPTVPNDVFASPEYNFNIITGPNMGGKTIYIKQIALLQIMAQIGCYVPASSAIVRICDKIFTRVTFNDSIECNASTYILEMKEIDHILKTITPRSLVIIDELCRGTSSEEGASMSWAICEHLINTSAFIFFTTHFLYLTRLQDYYLNVANLHVTAEEINSSDNTTKQLIYKHKVVPGVTTLQNYGLILASSTNLPDSTISLAKELAEVISALKKPLPENNNKHKDDKELYKLAADVLEETRKPDGIEENIQKLIKEFKDNHPDIILKINNENSRGNRTDKDDSLSSNVEPLTSRSINHEELLQEDPLLPLKNLEQKNHEPKNNVTISSKDLLEDSIASTPAKQIATTELNIVISESDNYNTTCNIIEDSLIVTNNNDLEMSDECVDNRFQQPNQRNIDMKRFTKSIDQSTMSKDLKDNNYNSFVPRFNTPNNIYLSQIFKTPDSNKNLSGDLNIVSSTNSSVNNRSEVSSQNDFDDGRSDATERSMIDDLASNTTTVINEKLLSPKDSPADDALSSKMQMIFGSQHYSQVSNVAMPSQMLANPAGTEELQDILMDDNVDGDDDDDDDNDVESDSFCEIIDQAMDEYFNNEAK